VADVHHERPVGEERPLGLGPFGAPQQGSRARDELVGAEGLGDVVVGAELEPDDAVALLGLGRDHDDGDGRRARLGAQRAADLEARHARQHQVQDREIDGVVSRVGQRLGARRREMRGPAVLFDVTSDQLADVAIIFRNENVHRPMVALRTLLHMAVTPLRRAR
jgi:hypothetical protein